MLLVKEIPCDEKGPVLDQGENMVQIFTFVDLKVTQVSQDVAATANNDDDYEDVDSDEENKENINIADEDDTVNDDDENDGENNMPAATPQEYTYSNGVLYVTNKHAIWMPSQNSNLGLKLTFYQITMHAIANDAPNANLYCQVEITDLPTDDEFYEVRYVPNTTNAKTVLDTMYAIFSQVASMNPDPVDNSADNDNEFFFNEDDMRKAMRVHALSSDDSDNDEQDKQKAKKQKL